MLRINYLPHGIVEGNVLHKTFQVLGQQSSKPRRWVRYIWQDGSLADRAQFVIGWLCWTWNVCYKSSLHYRLWRPPSGSFDLYMIEMLLDKSKFMKTYLNWKLSWMAPTRKMTSMMFKATRQKLKEFLIFGRTRTWPARMLDKTPILATMVLITPSSQYAKVTFQNCSDSEWIGQRAVMLSFRSVETLVKR